MEPWRGTLPMYRSWIRESGRDMIGSKEDACKLCWTGRRHARCRNYDSSSDYPFKDDKVIALFVKKKVKKQQCQLP